MNTLEQGIVRTVRSMTDEEILALVKEQLTGADFKAVAGKVAKKRKGKKAGEPRRAPKRMRAKKAATPLKQPKLSDNHKKALKLVGRSKGPIGVSEVAKALGLKGGPTTSILNMLARHGLLKKIGEGGGKKRPNRYVYETP